MNELTPSHPVPQPQPVQSRGQAAPYAAFSATGMNTLNLAAMDRAKRLETEPC